MRRKPKRVTSASSREPPLDEAGAILADIYGPQVLAEVRRAARSSRWQRHRRVASVPTQPSEEDVTSTDAPHLGIFWFVRDAYREVHLLAVSCPPTAADEYGDCLTSPAEHHKIWEGWRRGQPVPPVASLAPIIAAGEYEQWPRGRILFERPANRFVIYAGSSASRPATSHPDQD
jgi:hypothetical protein